MGFDKTTYTINGKSGRYWTATPMDPPSGGTLYSHSSYGKLSISGKMPQLDLFSERRTELYAVRCVKEVE
jgi:hypothetical protein